MVWDDGVSGPHRDIAGSETSRIGVLTVWRPPGMSDTLTALINEDGQPFADEIAALLPRFETLSNTQRRTYRDENAAAIAMHAARQLLIVAGPGSGKSFLFRARIKRWLAETDNAQIYVSSFVRKLVHDLEAEIANDTDLDSGDRDRVTVSTLHTLARSLIERNHGTQAHRLERHVQVIAAEWEEVVWSDVLQFLPDLAPKEFSRTHLARQLHTEELVETPEWEAVRGIYKTLSTFYNAVGFPDMIAFAREAVDETPGLSEHLLWIIDEYQDFNAAEDHLIRSLTDRVKGVLIAGDDDQVLYRELKSSVPEIIISYYNEREFVNAMLPFCSRCSYYVCLAASAFIRLHRAEGGIDKVFLPLEVNARARKIQVVATFQPSAAVDYIAKFLADHRVELVAHIDDMRNRREVDPFLLILTPEKTAKFYRDHHADRQLWVLLREFTVIPTGRSRDYRRAATYCAVVWEPTDNFAVRKALYHQGVPGARVHELLDRALSEDRSLASLTDETEVSSLLAVAQLVSDVVVDEERDPSSKSTAIARIVTVEDPVKLAEELKRNPLTLFDNIVEDEAEEAIETAQDVAAVEMMTMFKSKGLSAQHVVIIGCDDVNLARTAPLTFFVGITRARKSLHLISSLKAGGSTGAAHYLLDLPPDACDYVEYKKTGRVSTLLAGQQAFVDRLSRWSRAGSRTKRSR
ncbi:MAG: UvrD-helicase domain-containing protein [Acidimicrobiales bacterium]